MADLKGKAILIEEDDEPIQLPEQDNTGLIQEYGLSLIGKILNPKKQDVEKLIGYMPQHWGLEDRITAMDLGKGTFLFNFETEEELQQVLDLGPFHYNFWMLVLVRWEPVVHDDYPWAMTFWVHLSGIPLHLWTEANLQSIGDKLGYVQQIDVNEGKLHITVDSRKPLKFTRKIRCHNGDEATIQIKYDRLFKCCSHCGFMTHELPSCPIREAEFNLQRQSAWMGTATRLLPGTSQISKLEIRPKGDHGLSPRASERTYSTSQDERIDRRTSSSTREKERKEDLVLRSRHSSRETRGSIPYHKDNPERLGHPYRHRGKEDHRYEWNKREQTRQAPDRDMLKSRHQMSRVHKSSHLERITPNRGHHGSRIQVQENHIPKPTLGESSSKEIPRKEVVSEEVQSHHCELQANVTEHPLTPTEGLKLHSPMEEEQGGNLPMEAQMIGALNVGANEENDDNEDLLDGDLLGEDLELMEKDKKNPSNSASHEDSLNETITVFKEKVKSKGPKHYSEASKKLSRSLFPIGKQTKKAERRGSPRNRTNPEAMGSTSTSIPTRGGPSRADKNVQRSITSSSNTDAGLVGSQKPPSPHP